MLQALELKIPPLALVVIIAASMFVMDSQFATAHLSITAGLGLGLGLALTGAAVCVAGVVQFRRAHTTVNPMTPGASSALVTRGIYRFTRNPMYLGFLLNLTGWGFVLANLYTLIFVVIFVIYMNRFQIEPEERMLTHLFGETYIAYRQTVRRWL